MNADDFSNYLDVGAVVQIVGGPFDGGSYTSYSDCIWPGYLTEEGVGANRDGFARTPPSGYVLWFRRDNATGWAYHAYVHASRLGQWLTYDEAFQ